MANWKAGDVVYLKGGHQAMTVLYVVEGASHDLGVHCVREENAMLYPTEKRAFYSSDSLESKADHDAKYMAPQPQDDED